MAPTRRPSVSYLTDTLPTVLPPIFEQAQHTTANHRKNIVQLRKIHEACAGITEAGTKGTRLVGEKSFNTLFVDMVNRVLPVKKGVAVADRVVKFVASYVAYTTEQDAVNKAEDDDAETMSSRFVSKLLRHLLSGMEAKDKNVRFRVTLLTVSLINGLGEIDDDSYVLLRKCLFDRARDKEAAVRVQATLGIAKLQSGEDEDELEDGEESLGSVLLDLLRYDPAAEVRRAALYNLPRNATTLPLILARTRDVDPILRRTVFQGSLSAAALPDARILTIAQREEIVRNGLGDREPAVRKAAASMLGGWVDQAQGDLLEFLGRFDVVSSQVAEDALASIFVTRPEVFESVEFDDAFWENLTAEKAFLSRVFVDHCVSTRDEARLENALPVVTALAFRIQDEYNKLVASTNGDDDDEQAPAVERAFVVGELLRLAVNLDYADEIGRRKMFQLAREMISQPNLPDPLIPRCLDVLSKISNGERDLIRLIVDVVTELREGDGEVEAEGVPPTPGRSIASGYEPRRTSGQRFDPSDPEAVMRANLIDLRCLQICISLLERVNTPLQDNSVFHGLLPDLIIPAVRNKDEPALRDQGLVCLGLCCMIDAKMATNSFGLFIQQLTAADDELKLKVVQVVFDLLMMHDIQTLVANTMPADKVVELVRHTLSQDVPDVQAAACEGTAKLMLAGMIDDANVLQSLVLLYFSPETADNQALRQCLTYFLPVYCYSSPENQRRMLDIFAETFEMLVQLADEFEDAGPTLLPLATMGLMMIDWLDPQKAVERDGTPVDQAIHLDLATVVLKLVLAERSRETRKTLCSFLGKLYLPEPDETQAWKIKAAFQLAHSIKEKRPLSDATSRNALNRFDAALTIKYAELEAFDEDAFRAEGEGNADVADLFGIVDDVEHGAGDSPAKRCRRADSITSTATDATDATDEISASDGDATPQKSGSARGTGNGTGKGAGEGPARAARAEREMTEEEEDDDVESMLGDDSF
ncbi:chromosome condensation complex Condensin, subunit G [Cryptotrichosporon argae]